MIKKNLNITNEITQVLSRIKDILPDEKICLEGRCYQLSLLLRHLYPDAEIWYNHKEGHVYTKIDRFFYDIRGAWNTAGEEASLLDHSRGHKPHRWKGRY